MFGDIRLAIRREKHLKGWLRKRKVALIQSMNPRWRDLSAEWPPWGRRTSPKTVIFRAAPFAPEESL
jgi:hypothetical protein